MPYRSNTWPEEEPSADTTCYQYCGYDLNQPMTAPLTPMRVCRHQDLMTDVSKTADKSKRMRINPTSSNSVSMAQLLASMATDHGVLG